jgi:3-oxoacyl-[acyl-carrier protein] reductase
MQSLTGQVAIITGAGQGIGRAVAGILAGEGATVAVTDVERERAERVATELRAAGHAASGHAVDVTDRATVEAMAEAVIAEHGRIDILAAVAGIYPYSSIGEITSAEWSRVMDTNVLGALHALQACLPTMRARGYGRIVLMSSITGPITGQVGHAHYGASKSAMLGLMRTAAVELAQEGITVNAVMPGNVRTEGVAAFGPEHEARTASGIPMKRLADPEEVGWAVRYFASPEAAYVTGQTLVIDGGQVLPEDHD